MRDPKFEQLVEEFTKSLESKGVVKFFYCSDNSANIRVTNT